MHDLARIPVRNRALLRAIQLELEPGENDLADDAKPPREHDMGKVSDGICNGVALMRA